MPWGQNNELDQKHFTSPAGGRVLVINMFGGPGAGKSTAATALFTKLKNLGYQVELAREVAKDFIWEGRDVQLSRNQLLITAMQYARLKDLEANGCHIAITDSPLRIGLVYANDSPYSAELYSLIRKLDSEFDNFNVQVMRTKPYMKFGRMQEEAAATLLDHQIEVIAVPDLVISGDEEGQDVLNDEIIYMLENRTGGR